MDDTITQEVLLIRVMQNMPRYIFATIKVAIDAVGHRNFDDETMLQIQHDAFQCAVDHVQNSLGLDRAQMIEAIGEEYIGFISAEIDVFCENAVKFLDSA